MSFAMISIAPDILTRLLALRLSDHECLDEVLRRLLTSDPTSPSTPPAQVATVTPRTNHVGVGYELDGERHLACDATEAMIKILSDLAQYDDDFFPKLV